MSDHDNTALLKELSGLLTNYANRMIAADLGESEENNLKAYLAKPANDARFRTAFSIVMHDSSMSWREKARQYIHDHFWTDDEARQRFEDIWKMATGEEWCWKDENTEDDVDQ